MPLSQDPAKAREFLGWSRVAGAKSLQPQTGWRCGQSIANPSPRASSLIYRENTGNAPETGFRVGQILQSGPFSGSYAAHFPEFGNREISADEQGIPRREQRNLLVMAEK